MKQYHVIDCHCDTISELKKHESLAENSRAVSLSKMQQYGSYTQLFAVWVDDESPDPLQEVLHLISRFYEEVEKSGSGMTCVLSADDLERVVREKKSGAMLTVENGNCLKGSLANLRILHRLGVRALTLTWNGANELADGIYETRGAGLSVFGREVVCEMNRLKMIVDVSHLSERGFLEVLSLSEKPVMASHSNSRALAGHIRNLTDAQIRCLSEKGGVIGLNLYPAFLCDSGKAALEDCLLHIRHITNVGGENCLVFGSDFDGFSGETVHGLSGSEDYGKLFDCLKQKGYSETFIEKLTHKNFIAFAKTVLC